MRDNLTVTSPISLSGQWEVLSFDHNSMWGKVWNVRRCDGSLGWLLRIHGLKPNVVRDALPRLSSVQHPALVPVEYCFDGGDSLDVLMNAPRGTLRDRFGWYQKQGLDGIPYLELVDELDPIVSALDEVYLHQALMHLALCPENLLYTVDGLQLLGTGWMQLLWLPSGLPLFSINERYAPMECALGSFNSKCDQYSLALIYAEMSKGVHPLLGPVGTYSMRRAGRQRPELSMLSVAEKQVLSRALQPYAYNRFAGCRAFFNQLKSALQLVPPTDQRNPRMFQRKVDWPSYLLASTIPPWRSKNADNEDDDNVLNRLKLFGDELSENAKSPLILAPALSTEFIQQIQEITIGNKRAARQRDFLYLWDHHFALEHTFSTPLDAVGILEQLHRLRRKCNAEILELEENGFRLELSVKDRWLRRWLFKPLGLVVRIQFWRDRDDDNALTYVYVRIRAEPAHDGIAKDRFESAAVHIVELLRSYLCAMNDSRACPRYRFPYPVHLLPYDRSLDLLQIIHGIGKDISTGGIGLYAPADPANSTIYVNLPWLAGFHNIAVPAQVARVSPDGTGWYEIGVSFTK